MVLATEIMLPPRRNSFGSEASSKSPPKSHWWFFGSKLKSADTYGGSNQHVAIQKLRESKWFHQDEERLFCAVIETGFIIELVQTKVQINAQNDDSVFPHNQPETSSHYGVVSVEAKKSKLHALCVNLSFKMEHASPIFTHLNFTLKPEIFFFLKKKFKIVTFFTENFQK